MTLKEFFKKLFAKKETPTAPIPAPTDIGKVDALITKYKTVILPARGKFVCESHYLTQSDKAAGNTFATVPSDRAGVDDHCMRSLQLLYKHGLLFPSNRIVDDLYEVYPRPYMRVWTPAEGGHIGQGARGDVYQTDWDEMWQGNMMFTGSSLPKMGTKFKLTNPKNNKSVIINMGYEIGPASTNFLGGVTTEVHWFLGSSNDTELVLESCDQNQACGPIETKVTTPIAVPEPSMPSRTGVLSFIKMYATQCYTGARETKGKNRSPLIDELILRQGGALGEPYCMYTQQELLDVIRRNFKVNIDLPEGGSTQSFWEAVPKKYKTQKPTPLSIAIFRLGDSWKGHAALCLSFDDGDKFKTFEGNTSSGSNLERDGEGFYFKERSINGYPGYTLRGFVDIMAAMTPKG